ncbi:MAG: TrkH family potassium uptake protein, partial [Bacillota bacterium]
MIKNNDILSTTLIISSYLLITLAIILLIPLFLSFIFKENNIIKYSFFLPSIFSLMLGIIIKIYFKNYKLNLNIFNSMVAVTAAWLISSFIGSLPFKIALNKSYIDSFFEAVSGFTTTGITVFQNLEYMPKSIIFWRSMIQWLGGLGILTFFLLITFRSESNHWQLFSAESHKINSSRPVPNIYNTIIILWGIYSLFTFLEIILLVIFQMPLFDAIIHSFTTLSTGGFSNYDASIAQYQLNGHPYYKQIEYIITFFMLLGGINFIVHYQVLKGNFKEYFKSTEMKYFWKIIISFLLLIFLGRLFIDQSTLLNIEENFRKILFQIVSVMTTTGFGTENIGSTFFPTIAKQLFLVLMLIGGCVGSTSGGIKVIRIAILHKLFSREIKKIYLPNHAVLPVTIDKKIIDTDEVLKIAALFFAW